MKKYFIGLFVAQVLTIIALAVLYFHTETELYDLKNSLKSADSENAECRNEIKNLSRLVQAINKDSIAIAQSVPTR